MHGPLAQSVEQKTFNLLVDGSNPSRPTNAFNDLGAERRLFFAPQNKVRSAIHFVGLVKAARRARSWISLAAAKFHRSECWNAWYQAFQHWHGGSLPSVIHSESVSDAGLTASDAVEERRALPSRAARRQRRHPVRFEGQHFRHGADGSVRPVVRPPRVRKRRRAR